MSSPWNNPQIAQQFAEPVLTLGASSGPLAPWWIVVPLAGVALLATATHIIVVKEAPKGAMPESRRRIRIATGWVIMVTIPLSAYAFGIASPARPGVFAIVWMAVVGLLCAIVFLGVLDAINTLRVHRYESRRLREEMRGLQRGDTERDDLP